MSEEGLVSNVLRGVMDDRGDKFVDHLETNFGQVLYTSSAVNDSQGRLAGAILVGTRLESLLVSTKLQALADLILLDEQHHLLASTLPPPDEGYDGLERASMDASQPDSSVTQDIQLYQRDFQSIFAPFEARGKQIGLLGVVLPSSYVVAAEATSRNTFSLLFTLGTLGVIVIGLLLSQSIARPILKLNAMTHEVAAGNLDQSSGLNRSDEIGELAGAFDVMTLRLRERTQEASRLYAEAVQRNQELAEINEQLRATQAQLVQSEKLAAVGQLTAGIVHDVKNPLTVVKGMAELLIVDENTPPAVTEELVLIRDSVAKADIILSDLLTFARQSKPELGQLEREQRDLRETVEAALRLTAFPMRKAHVDLAKELPDEAVMLTFDNQQIEQVLVNLINNAIQAMPAGGELKVNVSRKTGMVAIAVTD
ncbi:MAG: sensor histidine kinase, partial [Anaerolineales bacterium]